MAYASTQEFKGGLKFLNDDKYPVIIENDINISCQDIPQHTCL